MPTKGGAKKSQVLRTTEPPLLPYEEARLRNCMQNCARLNQLGLPSFNFYTGTTASSQDKNSRNQKTREDSESESEYDPVHDDTIEEGLIDDVNYKGSKEKTHRKENKQSSDLPPGGVKFRSRKRVYADQASTIATRSKKSLTSSDICVPPPSHPNVSQTDEPVGNFEDHTQPNSEDGVPQHGHNTTTMAEGADSYYQITTKGRKKRRDRGVNMGHGLQRLTRAHGARLPVVITEGHARPLVPLIAAKFATECNIAVRNHLPVLKHWKDYKREPALIDEFLGILRAKFEIDTNNEIVKKGCLEMMKTAVRQRRYKVKKQYFDPLPLHLVTKTSPIPRTSNEQWLELVESWKAPKKMESCRKNKDNRGNVKYPHATGSCSYEVLVENLGDKYVDKEPDALDLFKETHYSKKKERIYACNTVCYYRNGKPAGYTNRR